MIQQQLAPHDVLGPGVRQYWPCISTKAKARLDASRRVSYRRTPLASKVHTNYTDARGPFARKANMFSTRIRPVQLCLNLRKEQEADLLALALELGIVPPFKRPTDRRLTTHLLGTFLDAVICGELRPRQ